MAQILHILGTQYPQWRLLSIIKNKIALESRYEIFNDYIDILKTPDDNLGILTINSEVTTGLIAQSLAESVQYIEELFALVYAAQTPDKFAKIYVNYSAGKLTNFIKGFKVDDENLCKSFYIPYFPDKNSWPNEEIRSQFFQCIEILRKVIVELIEYFKQNEYFYSQYKHGLKILFRLMPKNYSEDEIKNAKKTSNISPRSLYVYDSYQLDKVEQNPGRLPRKVLQTTQHPDIVKVASQLYKDDNLLRSVLHGNSDLEIEAILNIAEKTYTVLEAFRMTLNNHCLGTEDRSSTTVWLPTDTPRRWFTLDFA